MRYICYTLLVFSLLSCGSKETENVTSDKESVNPTPEIIEPIIDKEDLVEIKGNTYTEYYPGKENIRFQGPQDEEGNRHGKWLFFSETGEELSMTMYEHGKKHGHSIVKYPNGVLRYTGEYADDQPVGIWKTYNTNGEMTNVKDYGYPEK